MFSGPLGSDIRPFASARRLKTLVLIDTDMGKIKSETF